MHEFKLAVYDSGVRRKRYLSTTFKYRLRRTRRQSSKLYSEDNKLVKVVRKKERPYRPLSFLTTSYSDSRPSFPSFQFLKLSISSFKALNT